MRKSLIYLLLAGAIPSAGMHDAFAQRGSTKTITTTRLAGVQETFEHTEAFSLEAGHEMLVTPLVASVKVLSRNNDGKHLREQPSPGQPGRTSPPGLAGNEYLVGKLMDGRRWPPSTWTC